MQLADERRDEARGRDVEEGQDADGCRLRSCAGGTTRSSRSRSSRRRSAVVTPPARLTTGSMPYGLVSDQWPWRSIRPGVTISPVTSTTRSSDAGATLPVGATSAIRPPSMTTSRRSSTPAAGSISRPPAKMVLVTVAIVHTSERPHDHLRRPRRPDAHQRARLRHARGRNADGARGRRRDGRRGRVVRPDRRPAGDRQPADRRRDRAPRQATSRPARPPG